MPPGHTSAEEVLDKKIYEDGLAVRREVLGAEYVDRALANADSFNQPLQDFVTAYCWGGVWTRPGLPRKTRSLLNLAMLTALGRNHEFKLHVRGALNNGVTRDEIAEVLLQAGVYAGVPAAVESFRLAKEVFDETDKKK
jgi:4-carboxymuconolactone decarboxylase